MKTAVQNKIQRYESYKDSGVEWLGEIPEHWEVRKFKFVLKQSKGLTITKQNLISEGVFCVNYGEIHSKFGFELDTSKHKLKCVDEEYLITDSNSLLNKGDFVFADTSEDIEGSGNFTHLTSNDRVFAGYHTVIARPKIEIISLFLAFVFDSTSFRNQIRKKVKGVKVYSITQSVLKETNIWIPPLPEQTKIAQFLDDKITKIDDAIAIKEQQINLLKERKQILIHKAVTRGLDDNVKLKDSGVEWIGEIPVGWEVKKVTHLFDSIGSGTTPTSGDNRYYDGKFNFLQTGDLNDGEIYHTKRTLKERAFRDFSSLKIYPKGSLVMAMYGATIGKLGILDIESATNQACCIFRKSDKIRTKYFFQVLLAFRTQIISFGYGGGQPNISQDLIKSLRFPIAPLSEQKEISEHIEMASQKIETAISLKQQEIEKLKEYKSSLINGVVTGKVKVC